jgi:hypothetical protein
MSGPVPRLSGRFAAICCPMGQAGAAPANFRYGRPARAWQTEGDLVDAQRGQLAPPKPAAGGGVVALERSWCPV